ncbi:TetR/AcrR family transcriptional regulator [Glycomyces halotolerans]
MVLRKQPRGKATAERLLNAAMDLYAERGPEAFTMTAVVETSGVSVGSLYHHFGSFDGLATALYGRCSRELVEALAAALRPHTGAEAGVRALVTAYLRWCVDHRDKAHFMLAMPFTGRLLLRTGQVYDATATGYEAVKDWFGPHIAAGRIASLPQGLLECLMTGPIIETVTRWLAGMPGVDIDDAFEVLPERIWKTVRGTES